MVNDCLICRCGLTSDIASLPCTHAFHYECITRWIQSKGSNATCPLCDHKISLNSVTRGQAPPPAVVRPQQVVAPNQQRPNTTRQPQSQDDEDDARLAEIYGQLLEQWLAQELANAIIIGMAEEEQRRREEALRQQFLNYLREQVLEETYAGSQNPTRALPSNYRTPAPTNNSVDDRNAALGCALCCSCIFPPLAVYMATGCSESFLLNIFLTLLGFIPGVCHACCVVASRME
uniref:RING-type domain-containing protein n=1 Tax=Acrobeloides nanus TaxID=290746 RepID=A0A914DVR5_9BILA